MDELRGKCGKGKDLGGRERGRTGGRRSLRGQTVAIPPPATVPGVKGPATRPAPGLGSLSQVSGIDAQEEEAIPRDGEGLRGCASLGC